MYYADNTHRNIPYMLSGMSIDEDGPVYVIFRILYLNVRQYKHQWVTVHDLMLYVPVLSMPASMDDLVATWISDNCEGKWTSVWLYILIISGVFEIGLDATTWYLFAETTLQRRRWSIQDKGWSDKVGQTRIHSDNILIIQQRPITWRATFMNMVTTFHGCCHGLTS